MRLDWNAWSPSTCSLASTPRRSTPVALGAAEVADDVRRCRHAVVTVFVDEPVGAAVADQHVGALAADQGVGPTIADERVAKARAAGVLEAGQEVVAIEDTPPGAALEHVIALKADQRVVAGEPEDLVGETRPFQEGSLSSPLVPVMISMVQTP